MHGPQGRVTRDRERETNKNVIKSCSTVSMLWELLYFKINRLFSLHGTSLSLLCVVWPLLYKLSSILKKINIYYPEVTKEIVYKRHTFK